MMTPTPVLAPSMALADDFRTLGITYWQKLVREGVPRDEARVLACAIAKFELLDKVPTPDQQQLILRFSRFLCRAQLWHIGLLQ